MSCSSLFFIPGTWGGGSHSAGNFYLKDCRGRNPVHKRSNCKYHIITSLLGPTRTRTRIGLSQSVVPPIHNDMNQQCVCDCSSSQSSLFTVTLPLWQRSKRSRDNLLTSFCTYFFRCLCDNNNFSCSRVIGLQASLQVKGHSCLSLETCADCCWKRVWKWKSVLIGCIGHCSFSVFH